jgi:hypothetical protein
MAGHPYPSEFFSKVLSDDEDDEEQRSTLQACSGFDETRRHPEKMQKKIGAAAFTSADVCPPSPLLVSTADEQDGEGERTAGGGTTTNDEFETF